MLVNFKYLNPFFYLVVTISCLFGLVMWIGTGMMISVVFVGWLLFASWKKHSFSNVVEISETLIEPAKFFFIWPWVD